MPQVVPSGGHQLSAGGYWPWRRCCCLLSPSRFLKRRLAARKRRHEWLRALDAIGQELDPQRDAHQYLAGLNRLFRAVALKAFPGTGCAGLQGEEWVKFIGSLLPENTDDSSLSALARGPYEPVPHFDVQALDEHARTWVRLYG